MLDEIAERAERMRAFLEPRWIEWKTERGVADDLPPSRGMCRFAAAFALKALEEEFPHVDWFACMGSGEDEPVDPDVLDVDAPETGGVRDADGKWRGHAWVEGDLGGERVVVDLTADQFGLPPVMAELDPGSHRPNWLEEFAREDLENQAPAANWAAEWVKAGPKP